MIVPSFSRVNPPPPPSPQYPMLAVFNLKWGFLTLLVTHIVMSVLFLRNTF